MTDLLDVDWKFFPGPLPKEWRKQAHTTGALQRARGMAKLLRWLKLPPEQVWAMGTLNSARLLGLVRKGRLEPGTDTDLVLWDKDLTAARTWVKWISVYEKNV